jgi:hypothetical protein
MKWQDVFPILISILVLIVVAILQKQSKLAAALTTTMPLTVPLAMWIVYASTDGNREAMTQFNLGMVLGIIPSIGFLVVAWLAARAGLKLVPTILLGYGVWRGGHYRPETISGIMTFLDGSKIGGAVFMPRPMPPEMRQYSGQLTSARER